jgi:DNA invertase Pin-like site-specific DNA recombinase
MLQRCCTFAASKNNNKKQSKILVMSTQKKYVAYYRVSTQKQGQSGLGLEAQKATVQNYVKCSECIVAEFVEVESGKKDSRNELDKALLFAKETGATLIIAKLDRLSRNVAFLFQLRDSGVKFECCDLPDLNTMSLGIFATFAQYEREKISQRTKDALKAKKEQGVKLGSPKPIAATTIQKGLEVRQANAKENKENKQATELALLYKEKGFTLREIATKLNDMNFKTRRGQSFEAMTVKRLIDRATTN